MAPYTLDSNNTSKDKGIRILRDLTKGIIEERLKGKFNKKEWAWSYEYNVKTTLTHGATEVELTPDELKIAQSVLFTMWRNKV
jgi:hypothetical protein